MTGYFILGVLLASADPWPTEISIFSRNRSFQLRVHRDSHRVSGSLIKRALSGKSTSHFLDRPFLAWHVENTALNSFEHHEQDLYGLQVSPLSTQKPSWLMCTLTSGGGKWLGHIFWVQCNHTVLTCITAV